jgi:nucleotide-binding universal stress UspA family protein
VKRYPSSLQQEALFDSGDRKQQEEAQAWARQQGARYALTGTVEEWRYKVGVDGEPAAGVTLQIVDVGSGDMLWSATGGKSGWSREALSAVAQQLIRNLLNNGLSAAR